MCLRTSLAMMWSYLLSEAEETKWPRSSSAGRYVARG